DRITPLERRGGRNLRKRVEIPRMGAATIGGRYRIERALGHGGMASVYLGRDTELERPVAIKLLAENLAGDDEFRRRFVREARLAARLSDPNAASVYAAGEDDAPPYSVMEHAAAETSPDLLPPG